MAELKTKKSARNERENVDSGTPTLKRIRWRVPHQSSDGASHRTIDSFGGDGPGAVRDHPRASPWSPLPFPLAALLKRT